MVQDELTQLAIKYKADKWGKHHYTPIYYDLFRDKTKMVKKVLEIGTAEGASLFMWRDFFPNAMIYGGEIDKNRVDLMRGQSRIAVFQCDQSWLDELISLINFTGEDLDLVIDDGSHNSEDQVFSCQIIMPMLKKDAIYIIEDVANANIIWKLNSQYNCQMIEVGKRYDDRLLIVRNK